MPTDFKIVNFNIRGRAEFMRLMLTCAGQDWIESSVTFEQWPKLKPTTPYQTMPYIFYKGKLIGQTIAAAVFIAKTFGFMGASTLDEARILEVVGLWEDQLRGGFYKYRFPDPNVMSQEDAKKQVLEVDMPRFFGYYEKLLKENGGTGYTVGNKLSLADFYIFDMIENIYQLKPDFKQTLPSKYPTVNKLKTNVEANHRLKRYLTKRPQSQL